MAARSRAGNGDAQADEQKRRQSAPASATASATSGGSGSRSDRRAGERASSRRPAQWVDASASAHELRVLDRPRARMRLSGGDGVSEDHVRWRRNLPKQLTPGDVHRHIAVRRRAAARLRDAGEAS